MNCCKRCGKEVDHLIKHHTSYNPEETTFLCYSCHKEVHSNPNDLLHPKDEQPQIGIRLNPVMYEMIGEIIERGNYVGKSDFARTLIRDHLLKKWPNLVDQYKHSGEKIEGE